MGLLAARAITEEQKRVYGELVRGRSVLLLGAAGTGKSEFIRHLCKHITGKVAVAAPTAMAAMNLAVGAVTIHSLFQIPPSAVGYFSPELFTVGQRTVEILKTIDYLVIDEVSMLRPDLFDLMENFARRARGNGSFFGGICLLLVGDFHQLPPIIRSEETELFLQNYGHGNAFLFDAKCLADWPLETIELRKCFRQKSTHFLAMLNSISRGAIDAKLLSEINSRALKGNAAPPGSLTITPYRLAAERKNADELDALPGIVHEYVGQRSGTFSTVKDGELPSPEQLFLKNGASVIFTCNGNGWVNGTAGIVVRMADGYVEVLPSGRRKAVAVVRHRWSHVVPRGDRYVETGIYEQIPLQLGYALTVHRIQGKTCSQIVIQRDKKFFAYGQLYVALSRVRTLDSVYLTSPISRVDAVADGRVLKFYENLRNGDGARAS